MKYKSIIDLKYYEQLEKLLFFNSQQIRYIDEITNSVSKFGAPKLVKKENGIIVHLEQGIEIQNLFVFDESEDVLIGLVLYCRENISTFTLLHIAINDLYNSISNSNELIVPKIIFELFKKLKLIKGVEFLKILYSDKIKIFRLKNV